MEPARYCYGLDAGPPEESKVDLVCALSSRSETLSLATILSGFEINNIGVQARISSAITLPHVRPVLPVVRSSPSHRSQPTKSASGEPGSSTAACRVKAPTSQTKTRSARQTFLGRRSPILVLLERVALPRHARDRCPLAPRWIPTVLDRAMPSQKPSGREANFQRNQIGRAHV